MDLPCTIEELTGSTERISLWDAQRLVQMRRHRHYADLCSAIDTMGVLSKESQGINGVLTSVERLRDNPSHRLYLMLAPGQHGRDKCIGIIKVGVKKLFIRNRVGALIEIDPLCVLDFFVCTTEQRAGHGRVLYEHMLQREGVTPEMLGIDRPSDKFLGFMRKHYGLKDFVPQTNNFVVFSQYFEKRAAGGGGKQSLVDAAPDPLNPYARNYGGGYQRGAPSGSVNGVHSVGASSQARAPLSLNDARAAIHYSGGGAGGSAVAVGTTAGHHLMGARIAPHHDTPASGSVGQHGSGLLPPIRAGSLGSSCNSDSRNNSNSRARERDGSVEPLPSTQPPVPTGLGASTGGVARGGRTELGALRTSLGERHGPSRGAVGYGVASSNLLGSRGRAQSPSISSAVDYNILAPGHSTTLGNSRSSAMVGGRRPW